MPYGIPKSTATLCFCNGERIDFVLVNSIRLKALLHSQVSDCQFIGPLTSNRVRKVLFVFVAIKGGKCSYSSSLRASLCPSIQSRRKSQWMNRHALSFELGIRLSGQEPLDLKGRKCYDIVFVVLIDMKKRMTHLIYFYDSISEKYTLVTA